MLRRVALALGCVAGMWCLAARGEESRGVIYDFTATWCVPCQSIRPTVSKLEREGLPIRPVDIDQYKDFANKYNINSVPTFVLVIDGKEAERHSGALSEADLRRLAAKIPATARPAANVTPRSGNDLQVELGEPAPFRSAPAAAPVQPPRDETRLVENNSNERRGLRDLLPGGRREEVAAIPPVVRGNDNSIGAGGELARAAELSAAVDDPLMRASVRIRVITNGQVQSGSGVIIQSNEGVSHILTCHHIFANRTPQSTIEVHVFDVGGLKQFLGKLLDSDDKADLGLVIIPTTTKLRSVSVAGPNAAPRVQDPVTSIGCSGGENPTRENIQVTDIDKFDGPHNVLCTGVPVLGRSGGGLFNAQGEVVGVCSAADVQLKRGFYSGLMAIQPFLDRCGLTNLYDPRSAAPRNLAEAPAREAAPLREAAAGPLRDIAPAWDVNPRDENLAGRELPARHGPVAAAPVSAPATNLNFEAGDAEAVVILRSKSNPNAQNRIIIIHETSPKFFSYLTSDIPGGEGGTPIDTRRVQQPAPSAVPAIARNIRQSSPASSKDRLLPTMLTQPEQPQAYVRGLVR